MRGVSLFHQCFIRGEARRSNAVSLFWTLRLGRGVLEVRGGVLATSIGSSVDQGSVSPAARQAGRSRSPACRVFGDPDLLFACADTAIGFPSGDTAERRASQIGHVAAHESPPRSADFELFAELFHSPFNCSASSVRPPSIRSPIACLSAVICRIDSFAIRIAAAGLQLGQLLIDGPETIPNLDAIRPGSSQMPPCGLHHARALGHHAGAKYVCCCRQLLLSVRVFRSGWRLDGFLEAESAGTLWPA